MAFNARCDDVEKRWVHCDGVHDGPMPYEHKKLRSGVHADFVPIIKTNHLTGREGSRFEAGGTVLPIGFRRKLGIATNEAILHLGC